MSELVYLAQPYSHKDPDIKEARFVAGCKNAAHLMKQGVHLFAPISMSHPIAMVSDLPGTWEYWEQFDRAILERCTKLIVLMLPGWKNSVGVQAEIKIAEELGLPIEYMVPV